MLALPEEGTLEGPEETGVEEPVLELRHVTFAYPGGSGVPALQDISLHTAAGGAAGGGGSHRRGQDHPGLAVRPAL